VLILGLVALGAAVGVNLWPKAGVQSFSAAHPLSVLAPSVPPGWTVKDTSLGTTEISVGETLKTLDLSDYFYKTYWHDGMAVRVYVAYWTPGRIDPRQVWSHQPDICWVGGGGNILTKNDGRVLPGEETGHSVPGRFRVFEFPQGREEVVFWHLVGGKLSGFGRDEQSLVASRWWHFENSLSLSGFGFAPKEQLVVRISTNRTMNDVVKSALWPRLTASFGSTGLFERTGSSN